MPLQLEEYLPALEDTPGEWPGRPLQIRIELIDEDPGQPRREFDVESLGELACTIAERGVRQPISVRRHPKDADRWLLNFGARRLRASKLAGRLEIPAFIDETADSYDQVIENEHRQALQPLELALFVERQLATGDTKAEVARRLGKSAAYLTYVCALINAPDWLLDLYRKGLCRGVRELYEARLLGESDPHALGELLESGKTIRRAELVDRRRQASLGTGACHPEGSVHQRRTKVGNGHVIALDDADALQAHAAPDVGACQVGRLHGPEGNHAPESLRVVCRVRDRPARVLLFPIHPDDRLVFVQFDGNPSPSEVRLEDIASLKLERRSRD